MGRPKTGIKREIAIPFRLNKLESRRLNSQAKAACLPRATYMRCKLFGVPYEQLGGKHVDESPVKFDGKNNKLAA